MLSFKAQSVFSLDSCRYSAPSIDQQLDRDKVTVMKHASYDLTSKELINICLGENGQNFNGEDESFY